ncbi:MAG TPA: hypothetical protein VGQ46_14690 [Thermoanaerobaculia bacterium]|nr:hypothetical protein [Thermoanaerobaculia bacterium]
MTTTPAEMTAGRVFNELRIAVAACASLKSTAEAILKAINSVTDSNRTSVLLRTSCNWKKRSARLAASSAAPLLTTLSHPS